MCVICDRYKSGEIDGKTALAKIQQAIKVEQDPNHTGYLAKHMFEISEMILSKEVPATETNQEADADWWNHTHSED